MYKRVLAIGDIHGMYNKLVSLMDKIQFDASNDLLVFLGDYIDRGKQPLKVLSYVRKLQTDFPKSVVLLKGNHEALMLDYFHTRCYSSRMWLDNGGKVTFNEFIALSEEERIDWLKWIDSLPLFFQYKNFYFCHAGVYPYAPLKKQREKDLLWIRHYFFEDYAGKETIVVGHTPVQSVSYLWDSSKLRDADSIEPLFLDNHIILCDTGAYKSYGKLSCVNVLTKQFWQA